MDSIAQLKSEMVENTNLVGQIVAKLQEQADNATTLEELRAEVQTAADALNANNAVVQEKLGVPNPSDPPVEPPVNP